MTQVKQPGISGRKPAKKPVATVNSDRITIFLRDQEGSIYGITSLHRNNIMDVTYTAINHEMSVTLQGIVSRGMSVFEPLPLQKVNKGPNGKLTKEPTGAYSQQVIYNEEAYNPTLNIKDESEMEKMWVWLKHDENDMTWDSLMEIRKTVVERVAKAKEEAEKKLAEEDSEEAAIMKQAQEEIAKDAAIMDNGKTQASKLVNTNGAPLNENTILNES